MTRIGESLRIVREPCAYAPMIPAVNTGRYVRRTPVVIEFADCQIRQVAVLAYPHGVDCLHGSIVNRLESATHMSDDTLPRTITSDQIRNFVEIRNKSGFTSNLQFQIDCETAGFRLKDLGSVVKEEDGSYRWNLAGGELREKGGKLEWCPLYVYLCMTAHSWGSDHTVDDAIKRCRGYAGSSTMQKYGYVVYRVHRDFTVGEIDGTIYTPHNTGGAEKVLDRIKGKKKAKAKA